MSTPENMGVQPNHRPTMDELEDFFRGVEPPAAAVVARQEADIQPSLADQFANPLRTEPIFGVAADNAQAAGNEWAGQHLES